MGKKSGALSWLKLSKGVFDNCRMSVLMLRTGYFFATFCFLFMMAFSTKNGGSQKVTVTRCDPPWLLTIGSTGVLFRSPSQY